MLRRRCCLFAYAAFCALEFSALLSPATLAVAFLCAGLMYAVTASGDTSAAAISPVPVTGLFMILAGGVILAAVNLLLRYVKLRLVAKLGGRRHLCRTGRLPCPADSRFLSGI